MMRALTVAIATVLTATACADGGQPRPDGAPRATSPGPSPSPTGQDDQAANGTLAYIDQPFEESEHQTPRLVVVELPEGQPRTVAHDALTGTAWSPAGDRIVYIGRPASPERPAQEHLLVADVAAGQTATVATGNFSAPDWDPDGQRVVVANNEPGERDPSSIAVVDLRAAQVTTVTDPPAGTDDLEPDWSPDGRRIAFLRNAHAEPTSADPGDDQVLTVATDGGDPRELTPGLFHESGPAWSPDGDMIAITASSSPGIDAPRDLYLVSADGGERTPLNVAGARHDVTFSPDGRLIAVAVGLRPDDTDLHIVDVSQASTVAVLDGDTFDTSPTWSPDGTHVAFVAAIGLEGQSRMALGDVASGQVRMLTETGSVESPEFAHR